MELPEKLVERVILILGSAILAGGAGTFGGSEYGAAEERKHMREIHQEEMVEARGMATMMLDKQRDDCNLFVERCISLCAGGE